MATKLPKFLQRFVKYDGPGRVVAFEEKHGTRRFLANTPEDLFKACLIVLKDRYGDHEHNWYSARKAAAEKEEALREAKESLQTELISAETIETLPSALREDARQHNERQKEAMAWLEESLMEHQWMVQAIDEEDGVLAYMVFNQRQEHQYEKMDFEYLGSLEED